MENAGDETRDLGAKIKVTGQRRVFSRDSNRQNSPNEIRHPVFFARQNTVLHLCKKVHFLDWSEADYRRLKFAFQFEMRVPRVARLEMTM